MHFPLDFRLGIAIFLAFIFSGAGLYAYSNEVSIMERTPQQRSQYVTVYDVGVSIYVNVGQTKYFGPWNAVTTPFDTIMFNLSETEWYTCLSIEGLKNGVVWSNTSEHHTLRYISVWPNDTYQISISNLWNQRVLVLGRIAALRTENITAYVTHWNTYTDYPYRSLGAMLLFVGVLAVIGTGVSVLLSRRKMKEVL